MSFSLDRRGGRAHKQGGIDRFLAQIYDEFLKGHRLIVDADEEVA